MQYNDSYAPYRPPLTAEQKDHIRRAQNPVEAYGRIALDEARKQLSVAMNNGAEQNALPDDPDICLRYPGVDPRGQYSLIDMKLKVRIQHIDAVLTLREESVHALIHDILTCDTVRALWGELKELAIRHRVYTRAEKLCWDTAAAESLHVQLRKLELSPVVTRVDIVLQGMEHLLGIREGLVPVEVERFYREALGMTFTPEQREAARRLVQPEEGGVLFAEFENVLLQNLFSMPENWGLTLDELEELLDEE